MGPHGDELIEYELIEYELIKYELIEYDLKSSEFLKNALSIFP